MPAGLTAHILTPLKRRARARALKTDLPCLPAESSRIGSLTLDGSGDISALSTASPLPEGCTWRAGLRESRPATSAMGGGRWR